MKKLSWILIITLLASCLSACGRKETVIYQGDTASTSDATDNPIRNLDYTVPGDKGTLTVQAQVDTLLRKMHQLRPYPAQISRTQTSRRMQTCSSMREVIRSLCHMSSVR